MTVLDFTFRRTLRSRQIAIRASPGDHGSFRVQEVSPMKLEPGLQLYDDDAGEPRWRAVAENYKIVATSGESYDHAADRTSGAGLAAEIILEHHPDADRILDRILAKRGERRTASNDQVLDHIDEALRDTPTS